MEDIRIGRKSQGFESKIPLTLAFGPFISPSPDRIALTIWPVAGDTIILTSQGNPTAGQGIRVNDSTGPVTLVLEFNGALVLKGFMGMMLTAPSTVTITEVLYGGN